MQCWRFTWTRIRKHSFNIFLTLSLLSPVGQWRGGDQPHTGASGGEGEQHTGRLLRLWPAEHRHGQEGAVRHAVRGEMSPHRSVSTPRFANRSKWPVFYVVAYFSSFVTSHLFQSINLSLLFSQSYGCLLTIPPSSCPSGCFSSWAVVWWWDVLRWIWI